MDWSVLPERLLIYTVQSLPSALVLGASLWLIVRACGKKSGWKRFLVIWVVDALVGAFYGEEVHQKVINQQFIAIGAAIPMAFAIFIGRTIYAKFQEVKAKRTEGINEGLTELE